MLRLLLRLTGCVAAEVSGGAGVAGVAGVVSRGVLGGVLVFSGGKPWPVG